MKKVGRLSTTFICTYLDSVRCTGHRADSIHAPVGARLAGDGVIEIAIVGKPGAYKGEPAS
jgi:hypothetical protein